MPTRKFDSDIKSLLHFDFPYFREPNDALRDEISSEVWTRNNVNFVGTETPNDGIIFDCPKFGYRCPSFSGANSFLSASNSTGIFTLSESGSYEFGFFMRVTSSTAGRVLALKNSAGEYSFSLSITNERKIACLGVTSSSAIALNTWQYILVRIANKKFSVFLDGSQIISGDFIGADCSFLELGGFIGQIDEFIFRHSASENNSVPTEPQKGKLDNSQIISFGNGKHGKQEIKTDMMINSYGIIAQADGAKIIIPNWTLGKINLQSMMPSVGDEVMIHVTLSKGASYNDVGKYAFRKITAFNGVVCELDKKISDEFNLVEAIQNYYVQAIIIPNFDTLNITSEATITPLTFTESTGGGIVAFRVKNNLTLTGKIISSGYGALRTDNLQLTHAGLISNFVINGGGGIFIAAKNFTASSNARIGASYSGDGDGENGASGYGAKGNNWYYASYGGTSGGSGGVGGGGGAGGGSATNRGHKGNGGNAGYPDATGGGFGWGGTASPLTGGTQGVTSGGNTRDDNGHGVGGGGGGAGGSVIYYGKIANPSGANVIIISEILALDSAALSTGGKYCTYNGCGGGSGTGFAYIAAKELR